MAQRRSQDASESNSASAGNPSADLAKTLKQTLESLQRAGLRELPRALAEDPAVAELIWQLAAQAKPGAQTELGAQGLPRPQNAGAPHPEPVDRRAPETPPTVNPDQDSLAQEESSLQTPSDSAEVKQTSGLETSGLETSGLETSGLEISGLEISGLETVSPGLEDSCNSPAADQLEAGLVIGGQPKSLFDEPDVQSPPLAAEDKPAVLAVLQQEVAACTKCSVLAEARTQTVFGVGNPNPRLVFFGEAPGADEDRLGEPFVGRAGQLLDKMLAACTFQREDVYIMNTLKCRPPGNRNPSPQESSNCRPFWERQLAILRPEFICCLGSVAATTLLQTNQSLNRLRRRFHRYHDAKVLVTFHPAYLLRNPNAKRDAWDDLKLLLAEMGIDLTQAGK